MKRLVGGLVLLALSAVSAAQAQQPLKVIVPYAAGGSTDVAARILTDALGATLGRSVVVENRPGALIAPSTVANAAPDGNTLLFGATALAVDPSLYEKLPYDLESDFVPVAHVTKVPLLLLVNAKVQAKNLGEFISLLKKKPNELNYGSAGVGSILHVATELMLSQSATKAGHVPYRGAAPAITDLMAGRIEFMVDPISTSANAAKLEGIRALAVTASDRLKTMPEMPTFKEAGLPDYEVYTFNVLMAPKGTPPEIAKNLNQAINAALKDEKVQKRYADLFVEPVATSTPESTRKFLIQQRDKWAAVLKNAEVKKIK